MFVADDGDFATAKILIEHGADVTAHSGDEDNGKTALMLRSRLYNSRGRNLRDEGRYQEALREYELALGVDEETHGPQHPFLVISLCNLGDTLVELGRQESALIQADRALAICRQHKRRGPALATCLLVSARALLLGGDIAVAVERLTEARGIWERYPDRSDDLAQTEAELATCRLASGDTTGAIKLSESALRLHGDGVFNPLQLAKTQLCLAHALDTVGGDPVRSKFLTTTARSACDKLGLAGQPAFERIGQRLRDLAPSDRPR